MGLLDAVRGAIGGAQSYIQQRVVSPVATTLGRVSQATRSTISSYTGGQTIQQTQQPREQYIREQQNVIPQQQESSRLALPSIPQTQRMGIGESITRSATAAMSGITSGMKQITPQQTFGVRMGTFLGNVGTGVKNIAQPVVQPISKSLTAGYSAENPALKLVSNVGRDIGVQKVAGQDVQQKLVSVFSPITVGMKQAAPTATATEKASMFGQNIIIGTSNIFGLAGEKATAAIDKSSQPEFIKGVEKGGVGIATGAPMVVSSLLLTPVKLASDVTSSQRYWDPVAQKSVSKLEYELGRAAKETPAMITAPVTDIQQSKSFEEAAGKTVVYTMATLLGARTMKSMGKAGAVIEKPKASPLEIDRVIQYMETQEKNPNAAVIKSGALKSIFDPVLEKSLNIDTSKIDVRIVSKEQISKLGLDPTSSGVTIPPANMLNIKQLSKFNINLEAPLSADKPTIFIKEGKIQSMGSTYVHEAAHVANKYGMTFDTKRGGFSTKLIDKISDEATAYKTQRTASKAIKDYFGVELVPQETRLTQLKTGLSGELDVSKQHKYGMLVASLDPFGINVKSLYAKTPLAIKQPLSRTIPIAVAKAAPIVALTAAAASAMNEEEFIKSKQLKRIKQHVRRKNAKAENYKNIFTQLDFSTHQNGGIAKNKVKKINLFDFSNPDIFNSNFLSFSNGLNSYNMLTLSFMKPKKQKVNENAKLERTKQKKKNKRRIVEKASEN